MARRQQRSAPRRQERQSTPKQSAPRQQQAAGVPATTTPQQPMMQSTPMQQGGAAPGLFGQMASTAAGVAVGHSIAGAFGSMFGGGSSSSVESTASEPHQLQQQQQQPMENPCEMDNRALMRCLDQNKNDIGACQMYFDMVKQCTALQQQATGQSMY